MNYSLYYLSNTSNLLYCYFCIHNIYTYLRSTALYKRDCRDGWSEYNGMCYAAHSVRSTSYMDSYQMCMLYHGDLVYVADSNLQDFLYILLVLYIKCLSLTS